MAVCRGVKEKNATLVSKDLMMAAQTAESMTDGTAQSIHKVRHLFVKKRTPVAMVYLSPSLEKPVMMEIKIITMDAWAA